jgi:K+-transporting ATPase KdpF subunit
MGCIWRSGSCRWWDAGRSRASAIVSEVHSMDVLIAVAAVSLFGYLLYALVRPERF